MHDFVQALIQFLTTHEALVVALIPICFALIRASKWGKANQDALSKVAEVIENIGDPKLKADITSKFATAPIAQKDAIDHAVDVADPMKTPKTAVEQIILDLARMVMPAPKGGK